MLIVFNTAVEASDQAKAMGNFVCCPRIWLLGLNAFFFAFIAPFLCWGVIEDPTHSHIGAHFVFDSAIVGPPHNNATHEHDTCLHDPMLRHNRLARDANPSPSHSAPNKRSSPIVTFISLLVLVFTELYDLFTRLAPRSQQFNTFLSTRSVFLLVPTPPPRLYVAV